MARDAQETTKVSDRRQGGESPAESPQTVSFEEGLARLADLVGSLEGGRLGLAESIAAYEQGVTLVRRLQAELADVEQRVKILTAAAENGVADDDGDEDDGHGGGVSPDSPPEVSSAGARKGPTKRSADRSPKGTGGRPRRLPGMDDSAAEV